MDRNKLIVVIAVFSTTLICLCVVIVVALYNVVPDYMDTRTARDNRSERDSDEHRDEVSDTDTTGPFVFETEIVEAPIEEPAVPEIPEPEVIVIIETVIVEVPIEEPAEVEEPVEEEPFFGSADNPIFWVIYAYGNDDEIIADAEEIALLIEDSTGIVIIPYLIPDIDMLIDIMCAGEAHMASLQALDYMLANEYGCAEAWASGIDFEGFIYYQGQIVARADSGIESFSDLVGTTFCRPSRTSLYGWILPSLYMLIAGLDPETDLIIIDSQSGSISVIEAVYDDVCEAGATFMDAREYVDMEDVYDVVVVIEETVPIPNENISFAPFLDPWVADDIVWAIMNIAASDETLPLVENVLFWTDWEYIDDSFYDPIRLLLEEAGVEIWDFIE
ncbi:MAG: PhnD/SsuA/transferrin family substrate-binding protein [Chloroflexi bacterium]|nr:PhnD/SsuA/transferrin family substrate-binding protein [Chloroflexota bacterium]